MTAGLDRATRCGNRLERRACHLQLLVADGLATVIDAEKRKDEQDSCRRERGDGGDPRDGGHLPERVGV